MVLGQKQISLFCLTELEGGAGSQWKAEAQMHDLDKGLYTEWWSQS